MHVLGTAGHVDHGKSTLVQRLTGIDPDRFAEEKRRGLTIDLGFAWLALPSGREVGLIDVPGHERFIKNMLSGAGGISVCLFVVAANEGWKPQSAEHLAIIDILGLQHGVVALTKSDLVDDEMVELAKAEVEENLAASSLAGAPVVACSAVTGAGLDELMGELDKALAAAPPAPDIGRPRLWIDRVFTIAGSGTVVTGTLMGGFLHVGDEVQIAPEGRRARVRTIQSHKREVDRIAPGNRVALNLAGLERQGAERGDAIVKPGGWRTTSRVDALIRVSAAHLTRRETELTEKGAHLLYVGSAETSVRVKLLDGTAVTSGEEGFAQLYLRDPLPLGRGDKFVLRDAGRIMTLGGGLVLDPSPALATRGDPKHLALLADLRGADSDGALRALVEAYGDLDAEEALSRSGAGIIPAKAPGRGAVAARSTRATPDTGGHEATIASSADVEREARTADGGAQLPQGVIRLGPRLVSPGRLEELQSRLRNALVQHHRAHPLEKVMGREALRAELDLDPAAYEALLERTQDVREEGAGVRLGSHEVGLDPQQQRARDQLLGQIESGGFQPPLAPQLNADPALLKALTAGGDLVRIENFYLTAAQAADARVRVRRHIEQEGPVTVGQIRDLLGTSRKYAVPLCEWLDSTGATMRRGDVRLLGPNP